MFVDPNTLNLDPDPGFWLNLDPDADPDPGYLMLQILKEKIKNNFRDTQLNTQVIKKTKHKMSPK